MLTGIKLNKSLLRLPNGSITQVKGKKGAVHFAKTGGSCSGQGVPLDGQQLRYIDFPIPEARAEQVCGDRAAWQGHVSRHCG
ncbi:hypothetical protein ACH79_38970 [Bradyrhizobium sp. CCBAU 051011]|uniref:hypothetical protein n=1 Tax=Bradyrhizobium sp. CCBAU 051011 TaxID=858422 RepID=UPI001373C529|nr:hypothetical protein [Bradyrhizobium sp. CCBAU 051011]QHO77713.1 hypothetical protein ACH79_38970 [Bradyrhizobium sp. CCBAU 051011]